MRFEYVTAEPPEGGGPVEMLCASGTGLRHSDIPEIDGEMTYSVWVRSETDTQISINASGESYIVDVTTEWNRISVTFSSASTEIEIIVDQVDCYFYKEQLESGNRATDWRQAPEDIDESIENALGAANAAQNAADTLRNDVDAKLVSFRYERDALYIYPRMVEDPTKIDTDAYHLRLANGSIGFQKGTELYPDLKLRPNSWIFGGTLYFRTADGGIAHRAAMADDYV